MKFQSGCAGCFAGLSCDTRLDIVTLLEKGEMSVMEIAKRFKVSQPTITHHLQYLKEAEIVQSRKEGRKVFYSIHAKCKKSDCNIF